MQELISALTAHEEECSREFEADLSTFCTRHMDAQLVQQLRQLVAEGEEDLAYRAFYALTIIYRNRKDYQQLQALFEENPHFAGHPSYHHLLILFQLEAETFFDALELLELAREDARQHRDNAGYLHLFAHLFVYTCEKSRGEMREQVRREYYDDVERAVEDAIRLDPAYAKFYCTKARVVAQRGRYAEAYSLINKAVATESSARKDYALRLLDYRHCETVILLQEQREYFQGEMEKLRRSVPSLPKPKTFVPGRGPKAYEGAILLRQLCPRQQRPGVPHSGATDAAGDPTVVRRRHRGRQRFPGVHRREDTGFVAGAAVCLPRVHPAGLCPQ